MRSVLAALLFALAVALLACSSVSTRYDRDPEADFSGWRGYAWYPGGPATTGDPRADNPLLHRRVVAAADRALAERGFTLVPIEQADFLVNHFLSTEQRLDVRTMNRVYMTAPHARVWGSGGWGGVGLADTTVTQYEQGTLVIDLIDMGKRRLVWRGVGTRRLAGNPSAEQVTRRVDEAVSEILAPFPPGS
jgi:hypothetical protein